MMNQEAPKRRKKVLYLITKATFGGAQRYIYDLATNLPQNEYEAGVAFGTPGRLTELLEAHGTPILEIPSLSRDIALLSDLHSFFEIRRAIAIARPDVLHLNSSKAAALGALAGRLAGIPVIVFTVHGWPFKESRNIFSQALIFIISWLTALLSTQVIVVSKTDEHTGKRMLGIAHKLSHIPLGRENLNPAPPQEGFKDMFGSLPVPPITPTTIRVVSTSELTPNKGLHYSIAAVAELTRRGIDCIYVVAGDGEQHDELVAYARELGIDDRIFFPGFIPDAARYLSGFDVYVLPSIKEGMPYALIEASLAGLPIVATTVIDQDFADQLSQTRLVPPCDVTSLADAIEELAKRSRRSTPEENRFPLTEMVNRTLELYV